MNTADLEATFEANKLPILGTGAAAVVAFALYKRRKSSSSSTAGAPTTTDQSAGAAGSSFYSTGGQQGSMTGAAYDSSASDVYGALSPQLSDFESQLTNLTNMVTALPVPALTAAPTLSQPAPPAPAPAPYRAPAPPPLPVASAPAHAVDQWYTVVRGDTLSGIASRFPQRDITSGTIAQQNGIANPNRIITGQRLHIVG